MQPSSDVRILDPETQEELVVPAFSTAAATIERAAKQRAGTLRLIRFFPDHGHRWPLWENGSATYTMTPDDYGLSDDLRGALREWYDDWERHVGAGVGWSDVPTRERWIRRGDELAAALGREVWAIAEVRAEHRDA